MSTMKRLVRFFRFVSRNLLGKMTKPLIHRNLLMKSLTIWKEDQQLAIDKAPFATNFKINRLRQEQAKFQGDETPLRSMKIQDTGAMLPKISVFSFDGNLLNWNTFWEQFEIAIHSKVQLTNAEKLAYLKHSLKDGPAGQVIEGLTQTSGNYFETIACLQNRYDRPRLIHQAHVCAVIETPSLKGFVTFTTPGATLTWSN